MNVAFKAAYLQVLLRARNLGFNYHLYLAPKGCGEIGVIIPNDGKSRLDYCQRSASLKRLSEPVGGITESELGKLADSITGYLGKEEGTADHA